MKAKVFAMIAVSLLKLTVSKQPKTPAARTGRAALSKSRSRLSKIPRAKILTSKQLDYELEISIA